MILWRLDGPAGPMPVWTLTAFVPEPYDNLRFVAPADLVLGYRDRSAVALRLGAQYADARLAEPIVPAVAYRHHGRYGLRLRPPRPGAPPA